MSRKVKGWKLSGFPALILFFIPWLLGVFTILSWMVKGATQ